jgi:hypothetical protein
VVTTCQGVRADSSSVRMSIIRQNSCTSGEEFVKFTILSLEFVIFFLCHHQKNDSTFKNNRAGTVFQAT